MRVKVEPWPSRLSAQEAAVVGFHDVAADGQAQPGAPLPGVVRRVLGRVEGLENTPQVLGGDSHAGVGHAQLRPTAGRVQSQEDSHCAPFGHGLARVDQKIEQDLLDLRWINRACGWPSVFTSSRTL